MIPNTALALLFSLTIILLLLILYKVWYLNEDLVGLRKLLLPTLSKPTNPPLLKTTETPTGFVECAKCGVLVHYFRAYHVPPYIKHGKRGDYIVRDYLCTRCKPKEKK